MLRSPGKGVRRGHVGVWLSAGVVVVAALVSVLFVGAAHPAGAAQSAGLIAFTRWDGIYVMRPDGSGVRALRRGGHARDAVELAWSPDGRRLAIGKFNGVWVMNADGSGLRRIVPSDQTFEAFLASVSWSPDGERIAFTACGRPCRNVANPTGRNSWDVWVVDADGGVAQPLIETPNLYEWDVDWSPSGRIAVTVYTVAWTLRIHVMDADGSNRRVVSPHWRLGVEESMPSWSPDGRTLVFKRNRLEPRPGRADRRWPADLWVMNANGGARARLTNSPAIEDRYPVWSPDGGQVAFIRWGGTNPESLSDTAEIFVMDADGSNVTRLTRNKAMEGSPAWQPVPGTPDT